MTTTRTSHRRSLLVTLLAILGMVAAMLPVIGAQPARGALLPCGDPATLIHDIQGAGSFSPLEGEIVEIEGVVVGDFQPTDDTGLSGFYVQEEDDETDSDPSSSEGIFVEDDGFGVDVNVGDVVRVGGTADEFFGRTQVGDVTDIAICGTDSLPAATIRTLPVDDPSDWEPVEGMLVTIPQDLFISEYFNYDRFGEIVLTTERQFQPTELFEPGSPEAAALAAANELGRVTLDDGQEDQNPDFNRHPNGAEFTLTNTFRGGDILRDVTGVVDFAFGSYKIQPTTGADYVASNPRPTGDAEVKGQLKVASFNVLNFFTTIDQGPNVCGPTGNSDCRGADSQEEFDRQLAKLIPGILSLDSDVVGLQEVENGVRDSEGIPAHDAILKIVSELNAVEGPGTWAWVGEPVNQFGDVYYNDYPIRNEIIYRTDSVTPIGTARTIADDAFDEVRPLSGTAGFEPVGRPPLAQTFAAKSKTKGATVEHQQVLTVVVNHFKSKGSSCASIDDPFDPFQGNCNLTRVAQSEALMEFVSDLQDDTGDDDVLIIGDLNSYGMEDPVDVIRDAGYTDLVDLHEGPGSYTFVFDGQLGGLDHALSSPSLTQSVKDVLTFDINVDEPDILDFDTSFKSASQIALYEPLPYRVSDHDPVIVGLNLTVGDKLTVEVEDDGEVRFATFNASLNRFNAGDLIDDLSSPNDPQAQNAAETIQRIRPDVVLINEFDFDEGGVAAGLFQDNYLSVSQNGAAPISYPHRYVAASNTGVPSGFDLNNDDSVGGPDDAFGFGFFEGQFAFVVYSMHPIDEKKVRTFQNFLWKDMPGALLPDDPDTPEPDDWYSEEELEVFRLSSKNHVDIPIAIDGETVHFLVSHPTPPVFDGDEDRNGKRNHDEIRFWADYIDPKTSKYIYDDDGKPGGLRPNSEFVIAGDLNSDPFDGDSVPGSAQLLLDHPLVNTSITPASEGGPEQAVLQGGANLTHVGDPAFDTADFSDSDPGNLRVDYVLPSAGLAIEQAAVFWPTTDDPLFRLVGTFPFPTSDHRLVWVDISVD